MENPILITWLNDFGFCPVSIYFHNLYGDKEKIAFQSTSQIDGSSAHKTVDNWTYSNKKSVLQGVTVYSEEYNLIGKIDIFDCQKGELVERKKHISKIFDGYIFQLYGQYFSLREMGYNVKSIYLLSYSDNKKYSIPLPEDDLEMFHKFEDRVRDIEHFQLESFEQSNRDKCLNCIYEPICDSSIV